MIVIISDSSIDTILKNLMDYVIVSEDIIEEDNCNDFFGEEMELTFNDFNTLGSYSVYENVSSRFKISDLFIKNKSKMD